MLDQGGGSSGPAGELPRASRGGWWRVGRCAACGRDYDVNMNPRITRHRVTCSRRCAEAAGANRKLRGEKYEMYLRSQRERYASDPEYRESRRRYRMEWAKRNPERVVQYRRKYAETAGKGAGS